MLRTLNSLLLCALLLGGAARAWSQPARTNAAPATNFVQATVTLSMGDVGGKIFGKKPDPARTRHYYIAAEPSLWDFVPLGRDPVCGKVLPPNLVTNHTAAKVRYVEYTDATFTQRATPDARLGILGPVLRGVVGDYLAVTFLNRMKMPLSMHPHGVKYDKDSEGSHYQPRPGLGAAVGPGAKFTYVWQLDESSGPMPGEPSSKGWLYHSHVEGDEESNMGLVGFIIVTDPKRARPDGTPADVDREMASLFMIFDESGLATAPPAAGEDAPPDSWAKTQEALERGKRYAINGLIFGNLSGQEMKEGERVRWYLFGLGGQTDQHTAHWPGVRMIEEGRRRTDVIKLLPASMKVADMLADNPGQWLLRCQVNEHMAEGMFASFIIHPRATKIESLNSPFFGVGRAPRRAN